MKYYWANWKTQTLIQSFLLVWNFFLGNLNWIIEEKHNNLRNNLKSLILMESISRKATFFWQTAILNMFSSDLFEVCSVRYIENFDFSLMDDIYFILVIFFMDRKQFCIMLIFVFRFMSWLSNQLVNNSKKVKSCCFNSYYFLHLLHGY